jgi:C-terminal processing protease CtpA/Prc
MSQIGIGQKDESILRSPTYLRLSGRHAAAQREYIAQVEAAQQWSSPQDKATRMSTKRALDTVPSSDLEFDVSFVEGELGARLEERGGLHPVSVVVSVTENGQAASKGVSVGCSIVGINGERFLSHAHTVSTLKHAKRPLTVRFRRLDL